MPYFLCRVKFFRGNPILEHEVCDFNQTEALAIFSHEFGSDQGSAGPGRILPDWSVELGRLDILVLPPGKEMYLTLNENNTTKGWVF
jgi:hypothetical protein